MSEEKKSVDQVTRNDAPNIDHAENQPEEPNETLKTNLEALVAVMERLRAPGGCPWDLEQDFHTLVPYVIEEAYEVVAAIDSGSMDELKDELGDFLFQVIFLSQLAREAGAFTIRDVIENSVAKMVRRHPHVFADVKAETTDEVLKNWAAIKEEEKAGKEEKPEGYLSSIPSNFPALMHAHKVSKKAAKVGFDWETIEEVLAKVDEEVGEFKQALAARDTLGMEEELGDILFAVANAARFIEVNPENALRKTVGKFIERFHFIEQELKREGKTLTEASTKEMEDLWQKAKLEKRKQGNTTP